MYEIRTVIGRLDTARTGVGCKGLEVLGFWVKGSAPPVTAEAASLIEIETLTM